MALCPFMSMPYIQSASTSTSEINGEISESSSTIVSYGAADKLDFNDYTIANPENRTIGIIRVECRQAECQIWFAGGDGLPASCNFAIY